MEQIKIDKLIKTSAFVYCERSDTFVGESFVDWKAPPHKVLEEVSKQLSCHDLDIVLIDDSSDSYRWIIADQDEINVMKEESGKNEILDKYDKKYHILIEDALEWLEEKEDSWGIFLDKEDFIEGIIKKAKKK